MEADLLQEVRSGLNKRKGEWPQIANSIPGVSYSWISQLGRGTYKSEPTYSRLKVVAEYLRNTGSHQEKVA